MIITTTSTIENRPVELYIGLVSGEAVMGANIFKDFFANIRDIVGGRSGSYERELRKAREIATEEMMRKALDMGANAIVGVDLDYEVIGNQGSNMMLVSVNGTAVQIS